MDYRVELSTPDPPAETYNGQIQGKLAEEVCGPAGIVARAFARMGYPDPWAPLKPATRRDKLNRGYNPYQDQTRTGKLQRDARNPTIGRGEGWIVFMLYPGQNAYAGYHQYGTAYMPARPPLPAPTEEDCARWAQECAEKLLHMEGFA